MTSANFSGFFTPSPLCPQFGLIYSTKFTQPPILHLHFGYPPPPSQCGRHIWTPPLNIGLWRLWACSPHSVGRSNTLQNIRLSNSGRLLARCNLCFFTLKMVLKANSDHIFETCGLFSYFELFLSCLYCCFDHF